MKMKFILIVLMQLIGFCCYSQYIGVRARYTETRLVDDSPNPPKRENRLILSFFEVNFVGDYTPIALTDYDIWIYKEGLQYGSYCGGVLDSCGNNYPGYNYTAPKAVAYYNSYYPNWIDCDPYATSYYIVNGHELDCGFITVSHWEDDGSGQLFERFTAPNICLPYYIWPHPYASMNYNFSWPFPPTGPYNWYSFACYQSTQQLVVRGVLPQDTSLTTLPVHFDNVTAWKDGPNRVMIKFSNLTESDINYYEVEKSTDGRNFQTIGIIFPLHNNGSRADYEFFENIAGTSHTFYYRIKARENNGSVFYSHIMRISSSVTSNTILSVYPNPVRNGQLSFQVTDLPAGRYWVELVNVIGQQKRVKEIVHNGGPLAESVQLPNTMTGAHQLIIRSTDKMFSRSIIIKN